MQRGAAVMAEGVSATDQVPMASASIAWSGLEVHAALATDLLHKCLGIQDGTMEESFSAEEIMEALLDLRDDAKRETKDMDVVGESSVDQVFLRAVIEFMSMHSHQWEKFCFLKDLLTKLGGAFSAEDMCWAMLQCITMDYTHMFQLMCTVIKKNLSKYSSTLRMDIMNRLVDMMNQLPAELTQDLSDSVRSSLKVLFKLTDPSTNFLPSYLITMELVSDPPKMHWALATFIRPFLLRKGNLLSTVTLLDDAELCRLSGPSKEDENAARVKAPRKHLLLPDDPLPPPSGYSTVWNRHANCLLQLLREGAPLRLVKSQIASASDVKNETTTVSDLLLTASILRAMQLVNASDAAGEKEDKFGTWWDEWQHFADQFYSFVESGMLDYEKFVHKLALSRNAKGMKVKDNALIWLLTQCLPLENVKSLFRDDVQKRNNSNFGTLLPMIMGFYNKEQANVNSPLYQDLRDTAVTCLLFRMYNVIGTTTELKVYLSLLSERVQMGYVLSYRRWWTDKEKNRDIIDYYNLDHPNMSRVCVLSSFMSQPIAASIYEFIQKEETQLVQYCTLAGDLPFKGKVKSISIHFLAHLSIRCRQRVLENIEEALFTGSDVKSPSLVDTYARLLYISPGARNKYRLQLNLHNCEQSRLHTLLEILNFRLVRYFVFHQSTKELFLDLYDCMNKVTNHQLWHSLENVLIKISLNQRSVLRFSKATTTVDFGEMLNRVVPLSIARTLVTKGTGDFSFVRELPILLERLSNVSPHLPSQNTRKFFPVMLKNFYDQRQPMLQIVTREKVIQEFNSLTPLFAAMEHNSEFLLAHYKQNPQNRAYLLCVVWLITFELRKVEGLGVAHQILQAFPPQELTQYSYIFVDFLLDESPLQGQKPLSIMGVNYQAETASIESIREVGGLLSNFVWNYNLINWETVILALADRDNDPNAFQLLDYLLCQDNQFSDRVEAFIGLELSKEYWKDDAFFIKFKSFSSHFPDSPPTDPVPRLPTYYGNVCLRSLPILDLLFGRLIENDKSDLLKKLITRYYKLYTYHEQVANFVMDTLFYYFESSAFRDFPELKIHFLKLLDSSVITFSREFTMYIQNRQRDKNVFSAQYFKQAIARLASVLSITYHLTSTTTPQQPRATQNLFHVFNEFPSTTQRTLTSIVIELLALPFEPKEITTQLVSVVFDTQLRSFSTMSSIGLIVASLPPAFHHYLLEKGITIVKQDALLLETNFDGKPISPFSVLFASDYSSNVLSYVDNKANKILVLLQMFFHYSSTENFIILPQFMQAVRPLQSLQQLFFLCKVVGPFVYRMAGNVHLLAVTVLEIFGSLAELNTLIYSLIFAPSYTSPTDCTNPLCLLEVITDFLYHCKHAFPKLQPLIVEKVQAILQPVCEELREKFNHWITVPPDVKK